MSFSNDSQKEYRYWFERAVKFLTRREHSYVELLQKLQMKGCDKNLAIKILDDCVNKDYLNLTRFAEMSARNQISLGYGPKKVKYLLTQHEISRNVITEVINALDFNEAKEVALRKINSQDPQKIQMSLYRRGF